MRWIFSCLRGWKKIADRLPSYQLSTKPRNVATPIFSGSENSRSQSTDSSRSCRPSTPVARSADFIAMPTPDENTGSRSSEEHTSELQALMRISYAVLGLNITIHTTIRDTELTNH